MLRKERVEPKGGMRRLRQPQCYRGSEIQAHHLAVGVHESRLHKRKPGEIPETGQGNSFGRSIREAERTVREVGQEKRGVIAF